MRVFLDQGVPHGVRRHLKHQHEVVTAVYQKWDQIENGALLKIVELAGFDVMITADKDYLAYAAKAGRQLALVVLGAGNWATIQKYLSEIAAAVQTSHPGSFMLIEMPLPPKPPHRPR